jgi:hypothetical protein
LIEKLTNPFVVLCCYYNSEDFIVNCAKSIASQDDDNLGVIFVDDCSTDKTSKLLWQEIGGLKEVDKNLFKGKYKDKDVYLWVRRKRSGSAALNQYKAIRYLIEDPECMCGVVDGDDKLSRDDAISIVKKEVGDNFMFCSSHRWGADNPIAGCKVKIAKSIRYTEDRPFRHQRWGFQHFRGFKKKLSDKVKRSSFYFDEKEIITGGSDIPYIHAMMDMAGHERIKYIDEVLYDYNVFNPINDFKIQGATQRRALVHNFRLDPYDKI